MNTLSKSPVYVATEALKVKTKALRPYAHRFCPKRNTQPQLFSCLALKTFFKTDYRGIWALLNDLSDLRATLGLHRVLHYTTFPVVPNLRLGNAWRRSSSSEVKRRSWSFAKTRSQAGAWERGKHVRPTPVQMLVIITRTYSIEMPFDYAILGETMIDREIFDRIKERHGGYASWAVWAEPSDKPKSNIGDMSIFDIDANPALLEILRNDVVMIGLNISRSFSEPFRNFHDPSSKANDFKIRHAFTNTPYYGAYMTDVVKHIEMVDSASVIRYLREDPSVVDRNVQVLLTELENLQCSRPTILAFGNAAHGLVADHLPADAYSRLVKLMHYSHRIRKEEYRQTVLRQIGETSA